MVNIDVKAFQKEGYTFEQIQEIIEAEKEFEKTGKGYSVEEAFSYIKKELFSKKENKCIR